MVLGGKYYKSKTSSNQGPGSDKVNADFKFYLNSFPNYPNQSNYTYPNKNIALFGENIFYFNNKISITPGFRFENIETKSIGSYKQINLDAAGNVIYEKTFLENRTNNRTFILLGLGASFKLKNKIEIYSNISENYRSVTFADISIINPAYSIDPDISDEKGYTIEMGVRGELNKYISFDISAFNLYYNDRIGFIQKAFDDGSVKSEKGNVGNALIYGVESLIDLNINKFTLTFFIFYLDFYFIIQQNETYVS